MEVRVAKMVFLISFSSFQKPTFKLLENVDPLLSFDLITSSDDRKVNVWKEGKLVQTLTHSDCCRRFAFDAQKRILAVGYWGGLAIWSTTGGLEIQSKLVIR